MTRLKRNFFEQPTLTVAKDLLGKILVFNNYQGLITETEAYIGEDDPACHAAKGRTNRTEIMYGKAGYSYVYLIYGMYYCLNVVTEKQGFPAAVLIRGVVLQNGFYFANKHGQKIQEINGPGKLCKYFGINKEHNKINLINSDFFYIANSKEQKQKITHYTQTPRIGIKVGLDRLWRFKLTN
jgi:DNA-3-methyladenine glycosylase